MRATSAGQQLAERGVAHGVGDPVEGGLLAVEDHQPGAVAERDLGQRSRRVDAERRAEGEEHVRPGRGVLGAFEVLGHEVLAEADGGRLQDPAAHEAGRVRLAGAHPVEGLAHRPAPAAAEALGGVDRAVDLDDVVGVAARGLVQAVDVLGDERVHVRDARELGDGAVAVVRRRGPDVRPEPVLPRRLPHLGVRDIVLQGRGLLRGRVLGPHPLRPAEVRDARLGRDAGAGEDHDGLRFTQPTGDLLESTGVGIGHRASVPSVTADGLPPRFACGPQHF